MTYWIMCGCIDLLLRVDQTITKLMEIEYNFGKHVHTRIVDLWYSLCFLSLQYDIRCNKVQCNISFVLLFGIVFGCRDN